MQVMVDAAYCELPVVTGQLHPIIQHSGTAVGLLPTAVGCCGHGFLKAGGLALTTVGRPTVVLGQLSSVMSMMQLGSILY